MGRPAKWARLGLTLLITGCAPDLKKDRTPAAGPTALFDLERQQKLPWPNVVAQVAPGKDGKPVIGPLQIPNPANDPLIKLINTERGFTALPVISFDFSAPISTATIKPGQNLLVLGVNPADAKDADDASEAVTLRFDRDQRKLRIYPTRPLRAGFQYVVVLTRSIGDGGGHGILQDQTFHLLSSDQPLVDDKSGRILSDVLVSNGVSAASAAELEQVRRLYQSMVFTHPLVRARVAADLADAAHVDPSSLNPRTVRNHIGVATAFVTAPYEGGDPTQDLDTAVTETLASAQVGQFVAGVTYPAAAFYGLQAPTVPHANVAYVAFGVVTSLDFRGTGGLWPASVTGAGAPVTVTVIVTYPKAITAGPVPVVIFQHGLGSCKNESVLAVADSFAQAGLAVVGLDIIEFGDRARTNTDPSNDAAAAESGDQVTGGKLIRTGEGFVRTDDLRITRDAIRQTVVDQAALAKAAQAGAFHAVRGGGDFAAGSATFAGTSLGGVLGAIFLTEQSLVNVGVLNASGAWLSRLFFESATFGPALQAVIAAQANAGKAGSEAFNDYVTKLVPLVQGLVDPAEPAYYLAQSAAGNPVMAGKAVLLQQVLGDPVVPAVSSEFLAGVAGLPLITAATPAADRAGPYPFHAFTQFNGGSHGALLTPDDPASAEADTDLLAVTTAMRAQLLTYLGSFLQSTGTALQVLISE